MHTRAQVPEVRDEHKIHHCRDLASPPVTLSRRATTTPHPVPRSNIIRWKLYEKPPRAWDGRLFSRKETDDQVRRRADEADNCNWAR